MGDGAHEDEDAVEGERDEEEIEVSVVPLPHTVPYPGAVVVEPLNTIVTDGAVTGAGRPEDLAGEAELELDGLTFHLATKQIYSQAQLSVSPIKAHLNFLGPGRRSVS